MQRADGAAFVEYSFHVRRFIEIFLQLKEWSHADAFICQKW